MLPRKGIDSQLSSPPFIAWRWPLAEDASQLLLRGLSDPGPRATTGQGSRTRAVIASLSGLFLPASEGVTGPVANLGPPFLHSWEQREREPRHASCTRPDVVLFLVLSSTEGRAGREQAPSEPLSSLRISTWLLPHFFWDCSGAALQELHRPGPSKERPTLLSSLVCSSSSSPWHTYALTAQLSFERSHCLEWGLAPRRGLMDVWMDGWMDGLTDGRMAGWMDF